MVRIFITIPGCPACANVERAVNLFNVGKPLDRQIKTIYYYSPPSDRVRYYMKKIYTEEEIVEKGLGPPIIIFDGIVIRRKKSYHYIDHPKELLAMLEKLDSASR